METLRYLKHKSGKYYLVDYSKKTYTPITEEEFYKQTHYKKSDVDNLMKSVNPEQGNDYLLLKQNNLSIPIDYKLVPLVKFLWKMGFVTEGLNQPDDLNTGFISFNHYLKGDFPALHSLKSVAEGQPYKILNHYDTEVTDKSMKKEIHEEDKLLKKGFLVIQIKSNYISLSFTEKSMQKLYEKLALKPNTKRLPGNVIVSDLDLKGFRKIQK